MAEKNNQIIFLKGKAKGLEALFNVSNFGYLALGFAENDNGFYNPTDSDEDSSTFGGFQEISLDTDPTYSRIPLVSSKNPILDIDTGKVSLEFTADLDVDNIQGGVDGITTINQFAICDSSEPTADTTFYAASVFPNFSKSDSVALTFVIEMKI